jgi:hypothetical protein
MKQVSFSRRAQWQNFRDGGFVCGSLRVHMLPSENALNREML